MLDTQKNAADSNDQIMHHIQNQIYKAAASRQQGVPRKAKLNYPGKPYDIPYNIPLYQHLSTAQDSYANYSRDVHIQQNRLTKIPLIGKIAHAIQTQLHLIALFYTNRALSHQLHVNQHLIESITQLTVETQKQQRTITQLQAQITASRES